MKHMICLFLVFSLLLSGCSVGGEWIKEPVTFYYIREGYEKDMQQVIASEIREASGHKEDLSYLLALYSMGPSSEDLKMVFSRNTTIEVTELTPYSIELALSENALTLSDANFTLACSCLALTCMDLADIQQVIIVCGDRSITIREDNLLINSSIVFNIQEDKK